MGLGAGAAIAVHIAGVEKLAGIRSTSCMIGWEIWSEELGRPLRTVSVILSDSTQRYP